MNDEPCLLFVGAGADRAATSDELRRLARSALAGLGESPSAVACVATIERPGDKPAVAGLAAALGVPVRFYTAERLEQETPRLANPSEAVFRKVGCHGVAEAAALAAAGPDAALVVPKLASAHATLAVARAARRSA